MKLLKIGSIEIPQHATLDLDQTFEPIGGETILRTVSGLGIKQATWRKLRTTISGGGWSPSGLAAIDYTQQQVIACITPLSVNANASREATLPVGRRSDSGYLPHGFAFMADGGRVATPVVMIGNVATLDAVTGAIGYQASYYPLLTCWASRPTESVSRGDASYRWELVAEEV